MTKLSQLSRTLTRRLAVAGAMGAAFATLSPRSVATENVSRLRDNEPLWIEVDATGREIGRNRGPFALASQSSRKCRKKKRCRERSSIGIESHARAKFWPQGCNFHDHSNFPSLGSAACAEWDIRTSSFHIDHQDRELVTNCSSLSKKNGAIVFCHDPNGGSMLGDSAIWWESGTDHIVAAKVWVYVPDTHPEFYSTLVHEIGHTIGYNHNPDSNSVMCNVITGEPYFITTHDCDVLENHGYRPNCCGANCDGLATEPIAP